MYAPQETHFALERQASPWSTYTFRLSKFLKSVDFPVQPVIKLVQFNHRPDHPKSPSSNFERNHFRGIHSNASQIISLFFQRFYNSPIKPKPPRLRSLQLVAGEGFEPSTFGLWARRAARLLHPAPAASFRPNIHATSKPQQISLRRFVTASRQSV